MYGPKKNSAADFGLCRFRPFFRRTAPAQTTPFPYSHLSAPGFCPCDVRPAIALPEGAAHLRETFPSTQKKTLASHCFFLKQQPVRLAFFLTKIWFPSQPCAKRTPGCCPSPFPDSKKTKRGGWVVPSQPHFCGSFSAPTISYPSSESVAEPPSGGLTD